MYSRYGRRHGPYGTFAIGSTGTCNTKKPKQQTMIVNIKGTRPLLMRKLAIDNRGCVLRSTETI